MQEVLDHRRAKDEFFRSSHHSPLPASGRPRFKGLRYWEPDPRYAVAGPVDRNVDTSPIVIQTTDGSQRSYTRVGRVSFTIGGQQAALTLFSTGHPGLFVPFRDATSGKESYGAGRYLDLEEAGDTVTIDFNYAYNPYCAYDEAYSCPLPPPENWLKIPIHAGERTYE